MMNRRKFLTQAGLASAGMLVAPQLLNAAAARGNVGIQLYSLRDLLPKDVKGVMAQVAKAGFKEIETFGYNKESGYWGLHSKEFSQLLKSHGLTSPSGHYGLDSFFRDNSRADLDTYIDVAHALGQEYIIVPSLNESLIKTKEDFVRVGQKMNELAKIVGKEGLKIGYHNHNFEWHQVDGTTFYDTLLAETDPKLVHMEMDIFWVVRAGHDPIEILKKHKGRFKFAHVKDSNRSNPEENAQIGQGGIDFKKIVPVAKAAGITHFVMEQENLSADPYASLAASVNYMKRTLMV